MSEKIIDIKKILPKSEILLEWEVEETRVSGKKIIGAGLLVLLIIAYFIWTKNYFGTIVILLGYFVFYLRYARGPKKVYFALKNGGIQADNQIFKYAELESFRLNYQAGGTKELKVLSKKKLMPEISIPIGDADPVKIKEFLLKFLPEKEKKSL
ncbi:MAG: hypothetical protein COV69_02085 [Parcubacteria group bacterium CG11_big_fil_rev_8_21_14_0_20_39_14]|nr:MAG: hypothetical protein COV69_02085 [Parcubacteria group bacterium CG11_big_fil_rev_8_21_14_0_20_39_14]PIS35668.1 MAG: hypothetical protein COT36_01135 [Parcubacteria group bacterium CG08_land_8_20_14_0_20_38_56]